VAATALFLCIIWPRRRRRGCRRQSQCLARRPW
jgi:hypothetical protein